MVQLKDSLISYPYLENDKYYSDQGTSHSEDAVPVIIGVSVACVLLIIFFVCFAYYTPWWCVYQAFCHHFLSICSVCNCVYWFYVCPCMDKQAENCQKKNVINCDRMYIQDFLTTVDGRNISDGRIIQLSNLKSNGAKQNLNKSLNSINMV